MWGYLTYQIWMGTRVFPGVAKMAIWGLCANPTGMGGGFPMVRMKSKNKLPPIPGSENTILIVVSPNFEPIYHLLTPPPDRRACATKTRYYRPPLVNSDITTRLGDLKIGGPGTLISR